MAAESEPWTWNQVLDREVAELATARAKRTGCDAGKVPPDELRDHLVGLGFSGGGIRSATFNLGVLQAFARAGLLRHLDYLSTVSGGGYIGSWLSAWIARVGFDEVEKTLGAERNDAAAPAGRPRTAEPDPIRFLRNYSNYVTPRVGALTGDTWAVVGIYLRNLLLNLVIVIGVLGLFLTIPRVIATGWSWVAGWGAGDQQRHLFYKFDVCALVLFVVAATNTQRSLDNFACRVDVEASVNRVYARVTLPFLLATLLLTVGMRSAADASLLGVEHVARWPLLGAGAHFTVWALARFIVWALKQIDARKRQPSPSPATATAGGFGWRVIGMLVCGAVGGLLLWALGTASSRIPPDRALWMLTVCGPPAVLLACLIASSLHTGFNGRQLSDEQREWLGRHGGLLLRHVSLWLIFFATAAYAPSLVKRFVEWSAKGGLGARLTQLGITTTWAGTTILGLVAGRSRATGAAAHAEDERDMDGRTFALELLARAAPYIFTAGLLLLLSAGVDAIWTKLGTPALPQLVGSTGGTHFKGVDVAPTIWTLVFFVSVGVFLALLIPRVDINEFSIHHLYRNRLIRCYLGASNAKRAPHPFTGFDARDDLPLVDLLPSKAVADGKTPGPFHLVNTTLNLVGGGELAWQKRRSASFTLTPLSSGYEFIRRKQQVSTDRLAHAAYRPTARYAAAGGGMTLGSAMAISGAAASPNMGFHSSAPLAFLMTVFNVRLGWWAPNPRDPRAWDQAGPKFGLLYLLRELLGRSNDRSRNVYVSDGGHFENLGLYELVRRRCRVIVLCDASEDAHYQYDDLSNAIQRCRVDFGVNIRFEPCAAPRRRGQSDDGHAWSRGRATIDYPDGLTGVLIYLKPSLSGIDDEISEDVRFYAGRHPDFPHETTADQWFDENQFESYRRLGFTIGEMRSEEIRTVIRPYQSRAPSANHLEAEAAVRAEQEGAQSDSAPTHPPASGDQPSA